jgi:hypothetical protein
MSSDSGRILRKELLNEGQRQSPAPISSYVYLRVLGPGCPSPLTPTTTPFIAAKVNRTARVQGSVETKDAPGIGRRGGRECHCH